VFNPWPITITKRSPRIKHRSNTDKRLEERKHARRQSPSTRLSSGRLQSSATESGFVAAEAPNFRAIGAQPNEQKLKNPANTVITRSMFSESAVSPLDSNVFKNSNDLFDSHA
jgi:hypothetical protein